MRLLRLRLGFATNSSSTHSIVAAFQKGIGGFEHPMGVTSDERYYGGEEFGWDNFTLVSPESKMTYLRQLIKYATRDLPEWISQMVCERITGHRFDPQGYIDHQSLRGGLPYEWSGCGLSLEFLEDFKRALMDERILILGGNDNSGGHPLREIASWEMDYDFGFNIARQEAPFVWTLFSRHNGHKATYALLPDAHEPARLVTPQLIDLKITDHCPYNCAFCYQGSTPEGKHMDDHDAYYYAKAFSEARVFEVALGGGEPTLHPKFASILRAFASTGVVPNFTTKSTKWLEDEKTVEAVCEYAGAFAFSVERPEDIGRFVAKVKNLGARRKRNGAPMESMITIHYVMGAQPFETFEPMLREAKNHLVPVTLLGYKTTHRGGTFQPHSYDGWVEVLKRLSGEGGGWWHNNSLPQTGIDTVLASQHREAILAAGIDERLVYFTEGTHSMYIDAVERKFGASSFADRYHRFSMQDDVWKHDDWLTSAWCDVGLVTA